MALPVNLSQRELTKFVLDSDGKVAVNTVISGADISIGAVEIKDGATDIRQSIASTATGNPAGVFLMDREGHAADINSSGQLLSTAALTGNVTLNPSPNFIGLVTVANDVTVVGKQASGDAQTVNPVVGAGVYNHSQNLTAGQVGVMNMDQYGDIIMSPRNTSVSEADGLSNSLNFWRAPDTSNVFTSHLPTLFNGTTWDRMRAVGAANATTGVGTLGAGILGFDGTNYRRIITDTTGVLNANVSLSASSAYIGLASVNIGGTLPSLSVGGNFIGLVSAASIQGKVELQTGSNWVGFATVAIGSGEVGDGRLLDVTNTIYAGIYSTATGNPLMTALMDRTGQVADINTTGELLVKHTDTIPVTESGTWNVGLTGNVTLNPSPNFIGLVTVANNITLVEPISVDDNSGSLTVDWLSGATVNVGNVVPVSDNSGSLTIDFLSGATITPASLPALTAGTAYVGLASVNIGGTLPALAAGTNYIGLASVNIGGTLPALSAGVNYVGLASVNIGGTLPALAAGTNYIGLATVILGDGPILGAGNQQGMYVSTASGMAINIIVRDKDGNTMDVDESGNLLATTYSRGSDDGGTTWRALKTDVGGALQIDVEGALPAGTNAIGKLAANSGVDIGDVDVLSLPALATGTNYIGLATVVVGNSVTVGSHAVTNAGTFAVQEDGAALTALQIMDDWDESDRAKVNPIAGQAGVQGGSGVVTALTQRTVLATDVALPAGTNAIGKLAANTGVDIGDVDVLSLPALATGTNYIGLASVNVGGSLPAGSNFIGLVSTASIRGDVNLSTLISGEDQTNNVMMVEGQFTNATFSANSTVAVKSAAGLLHVINIANISCPTISLWDNTVPSGTLIHRFFPDSPRQTYTFDCKFTTGLTIDALTGVTPQLQISYR